MRITDVSVEGCGRFHKLTRVEGFGPGVNILSARNEAGKSTIFRAIRTCLFERHSSTNKEIAALQSEGFSLPVIITVGFEKDGEHYQIRKSFLRSKSASFLRGGVETARNTEADEEVWKLLGVQPRSSKALDDAAYGLLWVEQGRSFEPPSPSEAAKGVLNSVIQQEVGTLVGGERARLLLKAVEEELGRYWTSKGPKAGGPLDTVVKQRHALTEKRLEAERRLGELDDRLEELSQLRASLKTASDPATLQGFADQVKEARTSLAAAEKSEDEIKRLALEERSAHEMLELQRNKRDSLEARASLIDEQRQRLEDLAATLAPLDGEEAIATRERQEASRARIELDQQLDALDAEEQRLNRLEAFAARLSRRDEMERRLQALTELRRRAQENAQALQAMSVDDAALKALETIEAQEAKLTAALEAAAARLQIEARPGAGVSLNGLPVQGQLSRSVTEPLTIMLGDAASITVSPPAAALGSSTVKALEAEQQKLQALLARHGVTSAAELRQRRQARSLLEDAARELRAERSALGLKDDADHEIASLQAAIAEIARDAGSLLAPGEALPDFEAAKQSLAAQRAGLRAARATCEARISTSTDTLRSLAGQRGALAGQLQELKAQLEAGLALLPDEARAARLGEAAADLEARRETHRIKAAALAERQARAPAAGERERLASRIERLTAAMKSQTEEAARLREQIARIEGEVQNAGGEGLGERAAQLRIEQEMALAEEARLTGRAEVLKLLKETVERCYSERREQLNAPLQRHLSPFLNDVFPEAKLTLGESFRISGLSRAHPEGENFNSLSLGTQEQVAVLVRLAMGAMIADKGTGVPVILDDALVFSDDARIEQMFDALNRAGKNQQVIVLTCRARSFTSLGGRQLRIVQ